MRNQRDAIAVMSDRVGCTKEQARETLYQLGQALKVTLNTGERAFIPGIGYFKIKVRPARQYRKPLTNEPIAVPERKTVTFKPAADFLLGLKK